MLYHKCQWCVAPIDAEPCLRALHTPCMVAVAWTWKPWPQFVPPLGEESIAAHRQAVADKSEQRLEEADEQAGHDWRP